MKINKVINYCWFGGSEKNNLIKKCIASWKKFCPDYEIIEWNEDNYDVTKNKYMFEAYKAKKWAFVSDYARLDIIYNNGGIYLDTDVELIKPLDKIIEDVDAFFCYQDDKINTGLGFGAVKNNQIIKELLNSYQEIHFVKSDGSYDITSCVMRNNKIFEKYINNEDNTTKSSSTIFFSKEYFCPLDYVTKKMNITKNTIAIHWFGESWLSNSKKIKNKIKLVLRKVIGNEKYFRIKKYFKDLKYIRIRIKYKAKKIFFKTFFKYFNKKNQKIEIDVEDAKKYISTIRSHNDIISMSSNILKGKIYNLTIIIPVYNAEKTINRCIDSILNQKTSYKFMVKVINDGSIDETKKILEKYRDRIELINQKNLGRSEARNEGLKVINSDYIMFVDADDYISNDCVEMLLSEAYNGDYDIVEGKMSKVKGKKILDKDIKNVNKTQILSGFVANKVYKSAIWEKNIFLPGYEFEDSVNKFMIYPFYKKVKRIDKVTYYYCINELGITKMSLFDNISVDSFLITEYYIKKLMKYHMLDNEIILKLFMEQVVVNFKRCRYLDEEIQKCIFILTCDLIDKYWNNIEFNDELYGALKTKNYYKYKVNCMVR